MPTINFPHFDNLNDLMYWLEIQNKQGTPREVLWNELLFNTPQIDIELRSKAGHILETLLYKRNMVGIKWEKLGYIGLAINAYEKNVKDKIGGNHPYDRLRVLYSEYHIYDKAIDACKAFLSLPNHPMGYDKKKRVRFQENIQKLSSKKDKPKIQLDYPIVLLDNITYCKIPETTIQGKKISSKAGKAKYRLANGEEGIIEELVLEHFTKKGYSGLISENDYWWMIMGLLFWDIIFYPVPGMFFENKDFPKQDMPLDFFDIDFYIRREDIIEKLISGIREVDKSEMSELIEVMETNYRKYKYQPCRAIYDWDKFSLSDLKLSLNALSPNQLMDIMERLLFNFNDLRMGLPDLFFVKDNKPLFVECKGKNEVVSEYQKSWHKYLVKKACIPVEICRAENI